MDVSLDFHRGERHRNTSRRRNKTQKPKKITSGKSTSVAGHKKDGWWSEGMDGRGNWSELERAGDHKLILLTSFPWFLRFQLLDRVACVHAS